MSIEQLANDYPLLLPRFDEADGPATWATMASNGNVNNGQVEHSPITGLVLQAASLVRLGCLKEAAALEVIFNSGIPPDEGTKAYEEIIRVLTAAEESLFKS